MDNETFIKALEKVLDFEAETVGYGSRIAFDGYNLDIWVISTETPEDIMKEED